MNIQIITSSYPSFAGDAGGTAGLFVSSFALELAKQGHNVVVQPVARKQSYDHYEGITVEPIPWRGGDQELASMNHLNPVNLPILWHFFREARQNTFQIHQKYNIDKVLCMWVIPSGILGYWIKKAVHTNYDVWALGSDIWKIKKIPILGPALIKKIVSNAQNVFADGYQLAKEVESITQRPCEFLPSTRQLPLPQDNIAPLEPKDACHFLFVGRYHVNKGPDLLIKSISFLSKEIKSNLRVHLFGSGPLKSELKNLISQLHLEKIITVNGPIHAQECADYLKKVSFLVIPSRIESIPLVFSDAMQMGIPVIAMPVGDLPRIITEFQCGVVAEGTTEKKLARALEVGVNSDRSHFKNGIQKAKLFFEIKSLVQKWLESNAK